MSTPFLLKWSKKWEPHSLLPNSLNVTRAVRNLMPKAILALLLLFATAATASAQDETSGIAVEGASLKDETTLLIPAATIAVDGWLVIHDSNADGDIVAPAIISEPVALSAGTHEEIEITLTTPKAGGDKLFPMLHIDAGVVGTYEFPGADTPVRNGDQTVVVALTLAAEEEAPAPEAPAPAIDSSITVAESIDLLDDKVMIPSATIAQDGWIVIHDSDAEGNMIAPAIISDPVALSAGTTTDIVVTLTADITGDSHKVYAMLHIDAGVIGTYEFPGADAPVTVGETTVVVPFNVKTGAPAPAQMPTTGLPGPLVMALFIASALVIFVGVLIAQRRAA